MPPPDYRVRYASGNMTPLYRLILWRDHCCPHIADRMPINNGHPEVFVHRILDDALHLQLFAIQCESQTVSQHNVLMRQIFYGSNTVQAQAALYICIVEVGKHSQVVHTLPPITQASRTGLGMV